MTDTNADRDFRRYIVTDDPEVEAHLRNKLGGRPEAGGLSSRGLAEYAYTLGLYPPGYEEGQTHGISIHGEANDTRTYLIWDAAMRFLDTEETGEEDDEDADESTALWDAALGAPGTSSTND